MCLIRKSLFVAHFVLSRVFIAYLLPQYNVTNSFVVVVVVQMNEQNYKYVWYGYDP